MVQHRTVTEFERRARLGVRHRLTAPRPEDPKVGSIEEIVDDLVVLHATDPATIYLSLSARRADVTIAEIDRAMFDRRTLFRTLAMRRTLFVATRETAPAVERSSSVDVAATERKRLEQFLADSDIDNPRQWLSEAAVEVLAVLPPEGMPARAVTAAVPRLGTKITMGAGTKNSVQAGATSRLLGLMAVEGQIIRGRPSGDWTGRQYRWFRRDTWWSSDAPDGTALDEDDAAVELLRRWLSRFGPATVADMKWWTGWTMTKTRAVLARIPTTEVAFDGSLSDTAGLVLSDDAEPVMEPEPWARLLPALDPTAMGWKDRDWYVGPHRTPLFDRNGNIGPTVWVDGRIVGGWAQTASGDVVTELLEPVGSDHLALIDADCERVARFVGDTVVRPSFPTPLQKRLSAL